MVDKYLTHYAAISSIDRSTIRANLMALLVSLEEKFVYGNSKMFEDDYVMVDQLRDDKFSFLAKGIRLNTYMISSFPIVIIVDLKVL